MCPGNHDSNRGFAKLNKRPPNSAQADARLVVPIPASLQQPFQAYADFSEGMNVPPYTLGDQESFLAGQRSYRGINFVSYNSAWHSQGDADKGRLWIGLNLMRSLDRFAEAAWHLGAGATYAGAKHFNSCNLCWS